MGVNESNLFSVSALREEKGPLQVIQCVLEVKRLDRSGAFGITAPPVVHRARQQSMVEKMVSTLTAIIRDRSTLTRQQLTERC